MANLFLPLNAHMLDRNHSGCLYMSWSSDNWNSCKISFHLFSLLGHDPPPPLSLDRSREREPVAHIGKVVSLLTTILSDGPAAAAAAAAAVAGGDKERISYPAAAGMLPDANLSARL
jgi:hypothetical protein